MIKSLGYLFVLLAVVNFTSPIEVKAITPEELIAPQPQTKELPSELYTPGNSKTTNNRHSASPEVIESPEITATWVGGTPWMTGFNLGGGAFGGSIIKGHNFFGTSIATTDYPPIEIRFSDTDSTLCQTFNVEAAYSAAGVGVFPGSAWDMTDPGNPRRLNIIFGEEASGDQIWNPDTSDNPGNGKREYLQVMLSDYDGTGLTYAGDNMLLDADEMDVVYMWWPRVIPGHTLLESLPAKIVINRFYITNVLVQAYDNQAFISWQYDGKPADHLDIYSSTSNPPTTVATSVAAGVNSAEIGSLLNDTEYFFRIEVIDSLGNAIESSEVLSATPRATRENFVQISHWNGRSTYGDCWGYTDDMTGKEYALICARGTGVSVIDINVNPPVEIGFMPSIVANRDAKDVKVYQNYAVVIKENEAVQIFDLTDVTNPVQISTINMPFGEGAHNCLIEGDYLYIIGAHDVGGLKIYDISNPASPSSVGSFNPYYYHDVDIRGNVLAGAAIYGDGIDLVDISNKAAPTLITNFNYSQSGAHNVEFSTDGNYLYVGDEIGGAGNHIRVFDISNTSNVFLASEIIVNPPAATHNCYIKDDTLLYTAYYTEGLRLWNVADPVNPFEIGYFDTYLPNVYAYAGAWSTYPYFASGRILISDMQTGLYVVRPDLGCSSGDDDGDFVCDDIDNCLNTFNPGQEDSDFDGIADGCDNCPTVANFDQADSDNDNIGDVCDICCIGSRGNVNGDIDDNVNISDITYLVSYLFGTPAGAAPDCDYEANANGDLSEDVNISDVSYLTSYLFGSPSGAAPGVCP